MTVWPSDFEPSNDKWHASLQTIFNDNDYSGAKNVLAETYMNDMLTVSITAKEATVTRE